jgi:hypothetical protein
MATKKLRDAFPITDVGKYANIASSAKRYSTTAAPSTGEFGIGALEKYIPKPKETPGPLLPGVNYTTTKEKGRSFTDVAEGLVPYISNLRNAFQTAPRPAAPQLVSPVTLKGVSMDKARADIGREFRGATLGIDDQLRGNVAQAAKAGALATKMGALSDVSEREAAANAQIANQQAQLNLGVESGNIATTQAYQDKLTERAIAQQVQQSANIANAADKFMAQQAAKRAEGLEKSKYALYSRMFNQGVSDRALEGAAKSLGMTTEELRKSAGFRNGGKMRPIC